MPLDRFLHQRAQLVRLDGVELDGKGAAKGFRASIGGFSRAGRQIPVGDLLFCDRYALEDNVGMPLLPREKGARCVFSPDLPRTCPAAFPGQAAFLKSR
jgi:hypothetical protein